MPSQPSHIKSSSKAGILSMSSDDASKAPMDQKNPPRKRVSFSLDEKNMFSVSDSKNDIASSDYHKDSSNRISNTDNSSSNSSNSNSVVGSSKGSANGSRNASAASAQVKGGRPTSSSSSSSSSTSSSSSSSGSSSSASAANSSSMLPAKSLIDDVIRAGANANANANAVNGDLDVDVVVDPDTFTKEAIALQKELADMQLALKDRMLRFQRLTKK